MYKGINCLQCGRVFAKQKEAHSWLFLATLSAICNDFLRMRGRKCVKMRENIDCYKFLVTEKWKHQNRRILRWARVCGVLACTVLKWSPNYTTGPVVRPCKTVGCNLRCIFIPHLTSQVSPLIIPKWLRTCHGICKKVPIWYGQISWDSMTHPCHMDFTTTSGNMSKQSVQDILQEIQSCYSVSFKKGKWREEGRPYNYVDLPQVMSV